MRFIALVALASLTACSTLQPYGTRAVAERQAMNDSQARTAIHFFCDTSLGGALREWSDEELRLAMLICNPNRNVMPEALLAPVH